MIDVAIIGAGELGGAVAHRLARTNAAAAIRLIDETGRVAAGKALDIAESSPIEGFATQVSGSTDVTAAAGADVIVLADRIGGGDEALGDSGLMLLTRIAQLGTRAVIVCAGASHRDLVERGVGHLRLTRTRLLGSAPGALAAAARAMIALETNGSPNDIALTMIGVPPAHIVIPWEDAAIGGFSATRVLDEPARRRIAGKLPALWPPGPYALAAAAVQVIESIAGRSRRLAICFVAPETPAGGRVRTAALPVRLGPSGIVEVVMPELSAHDRVMLDNAMLL
jgi:malate dehydrogenase